MSHGIGWWHRYPWDYHVITKQQCRYYLGSMILSCLMLFIHIKLRLWMWGDRYNPEVEMSSCHCRAVVENVYAFYWKYTRWRHQRVTFLTLLAFCAGNSRITGEYPAQRPVTRSFDVFFDLHPNKWLNKQWRRWCFETPFRSLRHLCSEYTCVANQWFLKYQCHNIICNYVNNPNCMVHRGLWVWHGALTRALSLAANTRKLKAAKFV